MSIRTLVRRHLAFTAFVWSSLAIGFGLAFAAVALLGFESVRPFTVTPAIGADPIPDTVWAASWSESAWTAAQAQEAGIAALVGALVTLSALAAAMAAVNVLSLAASRSIGQRRDRAVRAALGAEPRHFLADRVQESAFLYGGGLLLAVIVALVLTGILKATWPAGLAPAGPLEWRTAAGLCATAALGIVVLTLPGRRAQQLRSSLAGGSATEDRAASSSHAVPVVIEVALALALASLTVLLLRHARLDAGPTAVEIDGLIALDLGTTEPVPDERAAMFAQLLDRVHELPGVRAESLASPGASLGFGTRDRVLVECGICARGSMFLPIQPAFVLHHAVSPGFFDALGLPVLAGRPFQSSDTFDSMRVAIVNETFSLSGFDDRGPIGRRVQVGGFDGDWYTIVGVVRDSPARGVGAPRNMAAALYLPIRQQPPVTVELVARVDVEPAELAAWVDGAATVVRGATVRDASTLPDRLDRATGPLRWFGAIFAVIAAAAVLLALHGVATAMRAQTLARRRELAIRSAVGARPLRVVTLVMNRAIRTLMVGVLFGWVGAWTAGRAIQLHVGGIPPIDLSTTALITAALMIAALAGALAPASRAARSSPSAVFREA